MCRSPSSKENRGWKRESWRFFRNTATSLPTSSGRMLYLSRRPAAQFSTRVPRGRCETSLTSSWPAGSDREPRRGSSAQSRFRSPIAFVPSFAPLHNYETIEAVQEFLPETKITVIDDIITRGRTTLACVSLLQERYPDADIRAFAFCRHVNVSEVDRIIAPCNDGKVTVESGDCFRRP